MIGALGREARVILAAAAFNVGMLILFLGLRIMQPSDGARLEPGTPYYSSEGIIITLFEEQPGGLQSGDIITTIDDRSIEDWASYLACFSPLCNPPERPRWHVGDVVHYAVLRDGQRVELPVRLRPYPLALNIKRDWGSMVYALAMFAVGAFVFYKRPDETAAQLLLLGGSSMLGATTWSLGLQPLDFIHPITFWLHRLTTNGVYLLVWIAFLHFALIFPNPHKIVLQHKWLVPAIYAVPFVVFLTVTVLTGLTSMSTLDWLTRIGLDQNIVVMAYLLLGLLVLVTNYRSQSASISRQQIRVVVYAIGLIAALAVVLWQVPQIILGEQLFTSNMMAVIGLLLPLSLSVSILRYRLWDIDVIINRATVYSLLTALTVLIYILAVVGLGALFQGQRNLLLSLFATGLVAVIFQPLRERIQRAVNRVMYGERDDPYDVISRLGHQLQAVVIPEDLLDTITETVAAALKLPYASIAMLEEGKFKTQSEYGRPLADPITLPLVHQGEIVGQLAVAPRSPHEPLTPPDRRLLDDIARHTGIVIHTVQLNADLRRSREKLVTTREEERRRLRRDLHDGLGPTLASQTLKLDAILDLLTTDPGRAVRLIEELKLQVKNTVADIRRLVYELRPPTLDDLGLIEALRAYIVQTGNSPGSPHITLEVRPAALPALSAAVEAAAYRITLEAITNVIRHAKANRCVVRLTVDVQTQRSLKIEIVDDGVGLPNSFAGGVGITSMRERAVELGGTCNLSETPGGGTHVTACLPLTGMEC